MTIEEAIKTAIQYEKKVVQVYEEAARTSRDEIAGNGYWFDIPEIRMES